MAGRRPGQKPVIWAGILFQAVMLSATLSAGAADLLLSPRRIDIGTFFNGTRVFLEAEIPAGSEAVVEVKGELGHLALMRKGRRGGLWMSVGEIQVNQTPNLYLVMSTSPELPVLAEGATAWGIAALKSQLQFSGDLNSQEKEQFFQEFISLKESEDLFATLPGVLKLKHVSGGERLTGSFRLPAKVPPGTYQVLLSVVANGRLLEQKIEKIHVNMVGFPAMMASLAFSHEAIYGLLAVLIAIATGFLMGFMFKDKGGH